MDALRLPLNPGSTHDPLHPLNVLHCSWAVLRHALASLSPDAAVVRRSHRSHRSSSSRAHRPAETASVASSRGSRRSAATAAGEDSDSAAATSVRHRRHRSAGASSSSSHRHRQPAPLLDGEEEREKAGAAAAPRRHRSSSSSSRRTRSAEEPPSAAAAALPSRRSHSDGVRGRTSRRAEEGQSGATTPRLSAPHTLSPAATAAAASGLTPPLAPPPPVSRGLGKPPLSGRQHAAEAEAESTARHRSHHRSSGSTGGLSSGRSSRTRRSGGTDDDVESNEGSVIVIRDGAGSGLKGLPTFFTTAWAGATSASSALWSPRAWWAGVKTAPVNTAALLLSHLLHAVPVMVVHYACELKRQLATLPLLRFSDLWVRVTRDAPAVPPHAHAAATSTHHDTRVVADWPPLEAAVESAPPATLGHLLLVRWMLQAAEAYIEKLCFLDETLVVRQLRSRRTLRRVLGWSLRLVSHTLFDPLLLSIVVPLLLSTISAPAAPAGEGAGTPAAYTPRLLLTVPGVLRGLGISAVGVVVQWLVMPVASRLVNRAVLTVFEALEYLVMRRYAHWSDDDSGEDDDDDEEEEDWEKDSEQHDSVAAITSKDDDGTASIASAASGGHEADRSASQQSASAAAARGGEASLDARVRREQRRLRREKRERRRRREQRQAARDQAMRHTILRAIVYRVVSSVVAQALVDHPLSVLVELLRGRATLHLMGMLTPYRDMSTAHDGLTVDNVWRFAEQLFAPHADDMDSGAGVPPLVLALRRCGRDVAREVLVISSSVLENSGQRDALAALEQRAARKRAEGELTSASDSAEFLLHSLLSLSPFYYGLQFTVGDKLLSFYMAVWTRLTRQ